MWTTLFSMLFVHFMLGMQISLCCELCLLLEVVEKESPSKEEYDNWRGKCQGTFLHNHFIHKSFFSGVGVGAEISLVKCKCRS